MADIRIHATVDVSPDASIGAGTCIWHQTQVREGATIGENCVLGKGVYIDTGVTIGKNVKIQNYASVFQGVTIEDGVFIGPHVCFTNDLHPRAINPDGTRKSENDWILSKTLVKLGAAIGANSTIVCGTTIGEWAIIGAGSVITKDIPAHALAFGNPARIHGFVCPCSGALALASRTDSDIGAKCLQCGRVTLIPASDWALGE